MTRPYMFYCFWEFNATAQWPERKWKLVECFGADEDGRLCTASKYASTDRNPYSIWANSPGRVVTAWNIEDGVWLASFYPPDNLPWLNSYFFGDGIKKMQDWHILLDDGFELKIGTARAVEHMLWPKEQE